ncbi:MAG: hypothetical protein OSB19_17885 [Opitutaceae bacterium]|jgi:hypothetical protein|nr:hypothetical protein [Opitutaceae bacterium]|tara:strand:+ start:3193 stop:3450 length:258 start_codon:yes stop_codon:yes gene_type:complete
MPQTILRIAGPSIFLIGIFIWMMGGARAGFSNTSIVHVQMDEITGIESKRYEDGFVPGIEFVAIGFLGFAVTLGAAAFFENKRQS